MPVVKLDAAFVKRATCPDDKAKIDYYSDAISGFVLEVRASGNKTYYQRYTDSFGRLRAQKIGSAETVSFEMARKQAQQIKAKIALGENLVQSKRPLSTLAEFVRERYMPYIQTSKRRPDFDEGLLRLHLLPRFGNKHLSEITPDMIAAFHQAKRASGLTPAYCNHMVKLMRRIYNLAKRWNIPGSETNPADSVPLLEVNDRREIFLNADQTTWLVATVEKSENTQLKYIVSLLLLTGARKNELLQATWDQFDLERRIWRVEKTKSGKPRTIPLSITAIQILATLPRFPDCPYVVPNPTTLKPFRSIWGSWDKARRDAGMPELRMHDLRHSFASALVNSGRSIYEVKQLLGHSKITTTERYAHLSQQTLLDATDAAAKATGIIVSE